MKNVYIYVDYADVVLTPGVAYSAKNYFNMYLKYDGYSYEQWKDEMQRVYQGEYRKMIYQDEILGRQERMSFIRSIPLNSSDNATANVVIFLDFDYFLSLNVENADSIDARTILLIDKNNVLVYGNSEIAADIKYEDLAEGTGAITKEAGGDRVVISSAESAVGGWKYLIITPEHIFWEKTNTIRKTMLYGIFLCLVLELFISYMLIKKNYSPLGELVSYFKNKLELDINVSDDEYAFVKKSLLNMLEKTETFSAKLEKQSAFMRENFIASLMKEKDAVAPTEELLEVYGIRLPYDSYAVMLVDVESMDETFWHDGYEGEVNTNELVKLVISNVVEELLNRENCGYMFFSDERFLCLINTPYRGEAFRQKMMDITVETAAFIRDNYKIQLRFSFGSLVDRLEDTSVSYSQAVRAMEYSRSTMMKETVFYNTISIESLRSYHRIRDAVYAIVKENYSDQNLSVNYIASEIGNHPNYVSKMFKEQTGEGIGEYINKYRVEKAKELLVKGELSPEEIAERVGYSNLRTFYRAFKKIEGVTPGKYV